MNYFHACTSSPLQDGRLDPPLEKTRISFIPYVAGETWARKDALSGGAPMGRLEVERCPMPECGLDGDAAAVPPVYTGTPGLALHKGNMVLDRLLRRMRGRDYSVQRRHPAGPRHGRLLLLEHSRWSLHPESSEELLSI